MALQLVLSLALNQFSSNMGIVFSLLSELSTKLISTQKSFEKLDLELGRLSFRFQQHGQLLNDNKIFDNLKKLREHSIYTAEEIGKAYEAAFSVNNQDPERIVRIAKDVSAYLGTKPEEFIKNLRNLSINSGVDELRQVGIRGATFLDFKKSGYTTQSQLIELVLSKLDKSVKGADESLYDRIKGRIEITNSYSDNLFRVGEIVNGILNKIYPKITSILDTLGTKVSEYLSKIDFDELFRKLESIWKYISDNIIPIFKTLIETISHYIKFYEPLFKKLLDLLVETSKFLIQNSDLVITFWAGWKLTGIISGLGSILTGLQSIALFITTNPQISALLLILGTGYTAFSWLNRNKNDQSKEFFSKNVDPKIQQFNDLSDEKLNEKKGELEPTIQRHLNELRSKKGFIDNFLPDHKDFNNITNETSTLVDNIDIIKKLYNKYNESTSEEGKRIFDLAKNILENTGSLVAVDTIIGNRKKNPPKDSSKDINKEFKGKVPPGQSGQLLAFEKSQKVNYVNITIQNLNGIQNGELKIVKGDEGQAVRQLTENVSQALQYVVATTFADNSNLRQNS